MGVTRCQEHALEIQWLEYIDDPLNEGDADTFPADFRSHEYIAKPGKRDPIRDYPRVGDLPARGCLVDAEVSGSVHRLILC